MKREVSPGAANISGAVNGPLPSGFTKDFQAGAERAQISRRIMAIVKAYTMKNEDYRDDPEYLQLTEESRKFEQEHQIKRMKYYNSIIGTIRQPVCQKCLNKGVVMSLRGLELVLNQCSCAAKE